LSEILSISTSAYDGYDFPTILKEISQLGASYVELAFIQGYMDPFDEDYFSEKNAKMIQGLLLDTNLSCFAFSAHMDLAGKGAVDIFKKRMVLESRLEQKSSRMPLRSRKNCWEHSGINDMQIIDMIIA
jgi:sugar phosphate isomerase/epimerase